jgi:hypothetical protein
LLGIVAAVALAGCTSVVVLVKPFRIPIAQVFGVQCIDFICYENGTDRQSVEQLYHAAANDISRLHLLKSRPRFIFCVTSTCYRAFGGGNERAISYPFLGTVIAPDSWQPYIVKHEMVHWLQFQEFGALGTMRKPFWLREGMAYSLSAAPAWDIPQQHSKLVLQYEAWARDKEMHDILKIKETNTESIKP